MTYHVGFTLILLSIVVTCDSHCKFWSRRSASNTTYGNVVFVKHAVQFPDCPAQCFEDKSCLMFDYNSSLGICTAYSSFATQEAADGSTKAVGPDYFVVNNTTVSTLDTALNVSFTVYKTDVNWYDARKACDTDGGRLISFDRKEKRNIANFIEANAYWVGLSDLTKEGHWMWENNATFEQHDWSVVFNDYDSTVSGNGKFHADCAIWNATAQHLKDMNCKKYFQYFICEYDL